MLTAGDDLRDPNERGNRILVFACPLVLPVNFDNCYISAWRAYRSGKAVWMACRKSKYAKLKGKMPLIARILGTLIIWPAAGFWLLGHMLIFGTWPHWIFCDRLEGYCLEAVPAESEKSDRLFPPLLFKTRTQKVD